MANPFLKGFLRSQFFDPPVQPFQFIAETAAGKKIFIQGFLMQPIRLQGFQPFPVCLGPFTFGGRIVEAMAQTATVVADSGSRVKMRSKPSTSDGLYWEVPVGATVQVAENTGGWAKVRYGDRTGYMMTDFLALDAQEPPEVGGTAETMTGGELITVQRAALQAVYEALGSILQGG